jgi:hypothetical protein
MAPLIGAGGFFNNCTRFVKAPAKTGAFTLRRLHFGRFRLPGSRRD